jgi:hypothetical protein
LAIIVVVPTLPQTVLINGQATFGVTLAAGVNEPPWNVRVVPDGFFHAAEQPRRASR